MSQKKTTTAKFRGQESDCSGASFAQSDCDMRLGLPCQKKNRSGLVLLISQPHRYCHGNTPCEDPRNRSYHEKEAGTAPGHAPAAAVIVVVAVAKPTAKPSRTAAESEDWQKASPDVNATARCCMSGPSPSESFFPPSPFSNLWMGARHGHRTVFCSILPFLIFYRTYETLMLCL